MTDSKLIRTIREYFLGEQAPTMAVTGNGGTGYGYLAIEGQIVPSLHGEGSSLPPVFAGAVNLLESPYVPPGSGLFVIPGSGFLMSSGNHPSPWTADQYEYGEIPVTYCGEYDIRATPQPAAAEPSLEGCPRRAIALGGIPEK